jgi:hypothetical protein
VNLPAWLILLFVAACYLPADRALAADFQIRDVQIELDNGLYTLNARVEYQLTETALEALRNGVPLTLDVIFRVERVWNKFWEEGPLESKLSYQIRYHALTELYRVVDLQSGEDQHFVTMDAAIDALGELQGISLLREADLTQGETYQLKIRAELDIESLPLPLRPLAYIGKGWKMTSGWTLWPLKR